MDWRLVLLRRFGLYRASAVVLPGNSNVSLRLDALEVESRFVATAAVYGLGAAPAAFGLNWAAIYLVPFASPAVDGGYLLWLPPAGWEAGYLVWGWVADRPRGEKSEPSKRGNCGLRRRAGFSCFRCGSLVLSLCPFCASLPLRCDTMGIFFLVMFLSGGFVVIALAHGATTQGLRIRGFWRGSAFRDVVDHRLADGCGGQMLIWRRIRRRFFWRRCCRRRECCYGGLLSGLTTCDSGRF